MEEEVPLRGWADVVSALYDLDERVRETHARLMVQVPALRLNWAWSED